MSNDLMDTGDCGHVGDCHGNNICSVSVWIDRPNASLVVLGV